MIPPRAQRPRHAPPRAPTITSVPLWWFHLDLLALTCAHWLLAVPEALVRHLSGEGKVALTHGVIVHAPEVTEGRFGVRHGGGLVGASQRVNEERVISSKSVQGLLVRKQEGRMKDKGENEK